MAKKIYATFDYELAILRQYDYIISLDEVGRGAIAGPVVVVASIVSRESYTTLPEHISDSKLVKESDRPKIKDIAQAWVHSYGIGSVNADTVDSRGIIPALRTAGEEAIRKALEAFSEPLGKRTIILLDGSHNWLIDADVPFFTTTKTKADRDCASVAASSIMAKVYRDSIMLDLHSKYPFYRWDKNKGYGAASHYEAIAAHGLIDGIHRKTWIKK